MVLLTVNASTLVPFYLTPTILPTPFYSISVISKTTLVKYNFKLTNLSTTDVLQQFDLIGLSSTLDVGTYDYYIYEMDSIDTPEDEANLLELGLLEVVGILDCVTPDIAYEDDSSNIAYYDCSNT